MIFPEQHNAPALAAHNEHSCWRAFLNTRMLICVFLGFTSGLPLFTLIQFPYTWKFLWALLMDRYVPRLPDWYPGRRRGWMFVTQLLVAVLTTLVALFGASSDIVIDAYRRELLRDTEQGLGNAVHVNAYKIAALVPGSLSLIFSDHLPWTIVFMVTAAFMLPVIAMTLLVREPEMQGASPRNLRNAVILSFREFLACVGWRNALLVLGFIFVYKLGDVMTTTLSTSVFLDIGFNKTQIGVLAKTTAFWASLAGGILRRHLAGQDRHRARPVDLRPGADRLDAGLRLAGRGRPRPGADDGRRLQLRDLLYRALAGGLHGLYIASTTDPRYTPPATQFALFTSLASVPHTLASASSGFIVARIGWFNYFLVCAALGIPGMLLLFKVAPWGSGRAQHKATSAS